MRLTNDPNEMARQIAEPFQCQLEQALDNFQQELMRNIDSRFEGQRRYREHVQNAGRG